MRLIPFVSWIVLYTWRNVLCQRSHLSNALFPDAEDPACEVSMYRRRACGDIAVHEDGCAAEGCCWVPCSDCESYIPWCFDPVYARPTPPPRRPSGRETAGTPGQIRLRDGTTPHEGRVEIFQRGEWGTVCDDEWDNTDATVVCREMGFGDGAAVGQSFFGEGDGPVHLDEVECRGDEDHLRDCDSIDWWLADCRHHEDAGVICAGPVAASLGFRTGGAQIAAPAREIHGAANAGAAGNAGAAESSGGAENSGGAQNPAQIPDPIPVSEPQFALRLRNGETLREGRVEIMVNGQWGTVCDDYWDTLDAEVVCRTLGFTGGRPYEGAYFGRGEGPIHMDNVNCDGTEHGLEECAANWDHHDCSHREDAGVSCEPPNGMTDSNAEVRLVGGSGPAEGRVEVAHYGIWGTVCDDYWDDTDAMVVCRQLGYGFGIARSEAFFGPGEGEIQLDSVRCTGNETKLGECWHEEWGTHDCTHNEDASAICYVTASANITETWNPVRLAGGDQHSGRVEVFINDEWGTVCDDSWDSNDARVVCRQLGFRSGTAVVEGNFGAGVGPIHMDMVDCEGDEAELTWCRFSGLGDYYCSHNEDAGVVCDVD